MLTQHQSEVVAELRRTLSVPADVSDEELLQATDGTLSRAGAELAVASRAVALPIVKELESACIRLDAALRRLRG